MTTKEKHEIINQVYELANAEKSEEALNILEKHKQDMPSDDFIALLKKVREASAKNI
jgi:flagellar motor component MotA